MNQKNLRVLQGDMIRGPFSHDQLRQLVHQGRVSLSDLASINNGPWIPISIYLNTAPTPPAPAKPPNQQQPSIESYHCAVVRSNHPAKPPNQQQPSISDFEDFDSVPVTAPAPKAPVDWAMAAFWVYRALMVASILGVVSPWYGAASEATGPLGGHTESLMSIPGHKIGLGRFCLLVGIGGLVISFFLNQWKVLFGIAIAAFSLCALSAWQLTTSSQQGFNSRTSVGGSTFSTIAGLDWGIWLTMAGTGLAAGLSNLLGFQLSNDRFNQLFREKIKASGMSALFVVSPGILAGMGSLGLISLGAFVIIPSMTPSSLITEENFDKIDYGLPKGEVESILGPGRMKKKPGEPFPGFTFGRINSANFGKIEDGMSKAEVESILGPGKVQARSGASVPGFSAGGISVPGKSMSGENMVWQDGSRIITITFINGEVMGKAQSGL